MIQLNGRNCVDELATAISPTSCGRCLLLI